MHVHVNHAIGILHVYTVYDYVLHVVTDLTFVQSTSISLTTPTDHTHL